jgi:2,3-bisphosphoglycerate-independent phosphoglycerate mutase
MEFDAHANADESSNPPAEIDTAPAANPFTSIGDSAISHVVPQHSTPASVTAHGAVPVDMKVAGPETFTG